MLDRIVKQARQEEVFSYEDMPLDRRVLAAFLSHTGHSYRKIEPFIDRSDEAIRQGFTGSNMCSSLTARSEMR